MHLPLYSIALLIKTLGVHNVNEDVLEPLPGFTLGLIFPHPCFRQTFDFLPGRALAWTVEE
jgi:hypothetical protein